MIVQQKAGQNTQQQRMFTHIDERRGQFHKIFSLRFFVGDDFIRKSVKREALNIEFTQLVTSS